MIELHGNIRQNYCQRCRRRYDDEALLEITEVQACECGGMIRPDIVWFGEMLPEESVKLASKRTEEASVFFSIGTSGLVYPAAGFPQMARDYGAYVVEINPEATPLSSLCHETIREASGVALPRIVAALRDITSSTPR